MSSFPQIQSFCFFVLFLTFASITHAEFPEGISNDLINKFKILWHTKDLGTLQKKPLCAEQQVQLKTFICPSDLFEKVSEPIESRAYGIVKSNIWSVCYPSFESRKLDISRKYQEFPTPAAIQSAYEHSELSKLGQFSHGVARACTQTRDLNQHIVISRFYSLIGRLNLASAQNAKSLVQLDRLLGQDKTPCPDQYYLSEGHEACNQQKKCSFNLNTETLAAQANEDLILLNQSKAELKKLPDDCKKNALCEETKLNYSKVIAGLIKRNPWFLDETYMDQSFYAPSRRLEYFFARTRKKLMRYQDEVEKAAKCIHLSDQSGCSMSDLRDLISRTPSLELADDGKIETKMLNSHLRLQQCIDEASIDRDKTAQAVSPLVEFAVTLPFALGSAAKGSVQAAKLAIPRLTALLGAEVVSNLSSYAENLKDFKNSCIDKRINLKKQSPISDNRNTCETESTLLPHADFEEGDCFVASGLAALSLVSPGFAAYKLGDAIKAARTSEVGSAVASIGAAKPSAELAEGFAASKKLAPPIERRIGSQVSHTSTLERSTIKQKLLHAQYTTESENLKWIDIAKSSVRGNKKFVEIENSKMKFLNDSIKDKDLVTALTNMHKQLTMEEFEILKKKYPQLKFSPYSDFKSLRFAIEGPIPAGLEDDLNKAFSRIQAKYKDWALKNNLIRDSDKPETWFKMGSGDLADEASAAARFGRGQDAVTTGFSFNSSQVKATLSKQLDEADSKRKAIVQRLTDSPLLQKIDDHISTLKPEVFEILRKSTDAKDAASKIEKRFGLKSFSQDIAAQMMDYAQAVDQFSPSLYIGKREVASLDAAQHGGFSIDFVGMGAQNLFGTAAALAGKSDLNAALVSARKAEGEVTQLFQQRRDLVKDVSEGSLGKKMDTICSGDDCVGITKTPMSQHDKQQLINNLANRSDGSNLRIAFIEAGIANTEARTQIATHGESIEKNLRGQLEGLIEPQRLKGLLFAIDMQSKSVGTGIASLMLASSNNLKLSEQEIKLIREAFKNAVSDFNKNLPDYPGYKPK